MSPIALDDAGHFEASIERLRQSLAAHISEQCKGNAAAMRDVEELFDGVSYPHAGRIRGC